MGHPAINVGFPIAIFDDWGGICCISSEGQLDLVEPRSRTTDSSLKWGTRAWFEKNGMSTLQDSIRLDKIVMNFANHENYHIRIIRLEQSWWIWYSKFGDRPHFIQMPDSSWAPWNADRIFRRGQESEEIPGAFSGRHQGADGAAGFLNVLFEPRWRTRKNLKSLRCLLN